MLAHKTYRFRLEPTADQEWTCAQDSGSSADSVKGDPDIQKSVSYAGYAPCC
jgi:hypothetical protein